MTKIVEHSQQDPEDPMPFYEYVDLDALDDLLMLDPDGSLASVATFTCSFEGYRINITPEGKLLILLLA